MWGRIARFVLRYRVALLIIVLGVTAFMTYHAAQVQMSYEFTRAIPVDNPKHIAYQEFRKEFGEDGNLMVIGFQTDRLYEQSIFNDFSALAEKLRTINAVEGVLSVPGATNLVKDTLTEQLKPVPAFPKGPLTQETIDCTQETIDSARAVFLNLPFYQGLLYNPTTNAYLIGISINKTVLNSKKRNDVVKDIVDAAQAFGQRHSLDMHYSGLPLIRTNMATRVANEMQWFLFGSVILSAVILLAFFRSFSAMLLSLSVVVMGVLWSLGTMHLFGYSITLLNALIPPLVVVIGIPNCIYFLNKYHSAFKDLERPGTPPSDIKKAALFEMISRMGVVTLFCNIAAAIGFAVFALTKSAILKEFGVVAGINIFALFFISLIVIPASLSFLPPPKARHTRYLNNKWLLNILDRLEVWSLNCSRYGR